MIDCKINKKLKVKDKISFIIGNGILTGVIKEKTLMDNGDISFLIETDDNKVCRIKHRYLDLYYEHK